MKTAESIYTKLIRKGLEPDFDTARAELKDLIGIRVVCPFEDEVYEVADRLKAQGDVQIIREKDYIKNPKKNGYTEGKGGDPTPYGGNGLLVCARVPDIL